MPNYFKKDWLQDWKREREMGQTRWILLHGAAFLLIASLVDAIVNGKMVWKMEPMDALKTILIYTAGGIAYGIFTWWFNERKLSKSS